MLHRYHSQKLSLSNMLFFFLSGRSSLVSLSDSVYVPVVSPPMLFQAYISLFVCLFPSVALRQSVVIKLKAASTHIPLGNQSSFLSFFLSFFDIFGLSFFHEWFVRVDQIDKARKSLLL